jgi:serine/threonine protein kinase
MTDSSSLIGQTISHYRIVEKLGGGGMGVVYKAEDTRLHRFVALKFLPPDLAHDRAALDRFRREAEAASALNHPNICTVYDIGEDAGENFIAMEFLDGKTLKHCIESKALPLEKILDWSIQIADGLNAAHSEGIIHRDIKTANIFVTKHGHAKVLDFGLAKLAPAAGTTDAAAATVTAEALLTSPGATVGTVAYMSPEQARGEELDARSDLFSFGSVLYEMATGRLAFSGSTSAVVFEAILNKAPTSPASLNRGLPPDLERVMSKALEKDREVRYQSAAELRADLKRVRRDTTSGQTAAFRPEEAAKRNSRTLLYAAGAVALVVLCVLGIFLYHERNASTLVPSSEWVQLTDFVDSATSPALSPDGRMLAFLHGAGTFISSGDVYVKLLPEGNPVQLTHDPTTKMSPVFSPDGSQVAYTVPPHWDSWIVPALGGEPRLLLPNGSGLTWIDSHHLLFSEIKSGRHMVIVTSMENRNAERDVYLPPGEGSMAHRSHISPDGKSVLVVWMNTVGGWQPCRLVSFDGHAAAKPVGPANAECTAAAWSPDGSWMYFSSSAGGGFHTWRQRFPDGVPEQVTSGVTEEEGIAVAPDGRWLVTSVGTEQSSIWVHDRIGDHQVTSESAAYFSSPDESTSRAAFSADGKRVYYLRQELSRNAIELRSVEVASGRSETVVDALSGTGFDLSPDGRNVAYSLRGDDDRESIWLAPLDHRFPPKQIQSPVNELSPAFGPDGTLFFMSSEGEKSFVYRMNQDGSDRRKITADPVVQMQTVSPDGQWVVAQVPFPGEDPPRGITAVPVSGGAWMRLCQGMCAVRWAPNNRTMFISLPGLSHGGGLWSWGTFIIPLPPGAVFPKLPPSGVSSESDVAAIPGAKKVDSFLMPGTDEGTYAFNRVLAHRNLFRIPLR